MALSESVQSSLDVAAENIRNALAYAARQERPTTCNSIAKILSDIEQVKGLDEVLDTIENLKNEF